jgi:predicted  nucleic acid-binding Zn-ribbon protein
MPTQTVNELREFLQFLSEKVARDESTLSPEAALDEWRTLQPSAGTLEEDVAAIQESLADMEKGDRGVPFSQFDRNFCKRHNILA